MRQTVWLYSPQFPETIAINNRAHCHYWPWDWLPRRNHARFMFISITIISLDIKWDAIYSKLYSNFNPLSQHVIENETNPANLLRMEIGIIMYRNANYNTPIICSGRKMRYFDNGACWIVGKCIPNVMFAWEGNGPGGLCAFHVAHFSKCTFHGGCLSWRARQHKSIAHCTADVIPGTRFNIVKSRKISNPRDWG